MISTGELRKGVTIELDNELWQILDYHHIKMGRGSAQVRIQLRNVRRGQTIERSFQAGTKWPRAQIEQRPVQFLYRDGDDFHFMDTDTYDQFMLRGEQLGSATTFLKDGMTLDRTSYQGETIGVELPVTVDLLVVETEPGYAGDTAQGARKGATTETACRVSAALSTRRHDHVDTRTGSTRPAQPRPRPRPGRSGLAISRAAVGQALHDLADRLYMASASAGVGAIAVTPKRPSMARPASMCSTVPTFVTGSTEPRARPSR
jgi:elongation factor P